jgi:hypothetical protein
MYIELQHCPPRSDPKISEKIIKIIIKIFTKEPECRSYGDSFFAKECTKDFGRVEVGEHASTTDEPNLQLEPSLNSRCLIGGL